MADIQKEIDKQILQAEKAFTEQAYDKAVAILGSIIRKNPDHTPAYRKLAAIHLRTKTPKTALPLINKALDLAADDVENWNMLGHYYVRLKIWDKALDAFDQSLKLSRDSKTEYEIVKIYRSMGDEKRLLVTLESLAEKYPDMITFSHECAIELYKQRNFSKALQFYGQLIHKHSIDTLSISLINGWRELMNRFDRMNEVLIWMKNQYEHYPESAEIKWLLALVYIDMKIYDPVEELLLKAYALDENHIEILYTLAYFYYTQAKTEKALYYFNKFFKLKPVSPKALRIAVSLKKLQYGDEIFTHLNYAAAFLDELTVDDKAEIHYALGKAYDDAGELKTAFAYYQQGGKYHSHNKINEVDTLSTLVYFVKKNYDKSYFSRNYRNSVSSEKPIFILGMPRSGTTLTESILSAHDGIFGAGELSYLPFSLDKLKISEEYRFLFESNAGIKEEATYMERGEFYLSRIESMAPKGTKYIIDKMPDNFRFVGFIPLLLSGATIIHTRRHPVEICLSAYRLLFVAGHYWSDDLRTMGRYYRLYHEIMQHWHSVLPEGTILDVRYEDMVDDPETQSKRLAAHIGIEWDKKCLEFHSSEKLVTTASALQVKEPIYKHSVNRWRKYEPYLEPLLDEIGDLVEAYEAELKNSQWSMVG